MTQRVSARRPFRYVMRSFVRIQGGRESHTPKSESHPVIEWLHVAIRHLQQLCMPLGRVAVDDEPPDDAAPVVDPGDAVAPVELLPAVLLPVELLPDADEPGA